MSFGRMLAVFRKELRQLARDKLTFGMIVGIPTLQLLLFGFAINMDIRHLPAALMDEADTWRSRELVAELAASQVLEFTHRVSTPQDIDDLLRTGKIEAAVVIPADFENRLETASPRILCAIRRRAPADSWWPWASICGSSIRRSYGTPNCGSISTTGSSTATTSITPCCASAA